jgi:hypothetical protein
MNLQNGRCNNKDMTTEFQRRYSLTQKEDIISAEIQSCDFHIHTVHLNTVKVFLLPTDAQLNCLKSNFKIYIEFDIISVKY